MVSVIRDFIGIGHFMFMGIYGGPAGGLLLYLWFIYKGYYILWIPYTLWLIYDRNTPSSGGRPIKWICNSLVWRCTVRYFPLHLIKTCEMRPDRNYILACHPHGLLGYGILSNFGTYANGIKDLLPGISTALAAFSPLFYFPFFRDYILSHSIISVHKNSLKFFLNAGKGRAVCVVVGGTKELLEACPGNTKIVSKKRKGFIKVALETGTDIAPVYVFGENDLFRQLHHLKGLEWLKSVWLKMIDKVGFPLLIPTSLIPKRRPLFTVIGQPIPVQQILNPSQEQIDELHGKYMIGLQELFEKNKIKYGYDNDQHLEFV